jgi:ppGpp synthetase/RelA/SpoT-type nucleotidyltranferase
LLVPPPAIINPAAISPWPMWVVVDRRHVPIRWTDAMWPEREQPLHRIGCMAKPQSSELVPLASDTRTLSQEHRDLCKLYESSIEQYDLFRAAMEDLITRLLREKDIYATAESRAKEPQSLEKKLTRKQYRSLDEIPDLAGVRIIVRYLNDVDRAVEILQSEFTVRELVRHSDSHPDETFGYLSDHVIVELSAERGRLNGWSGYSDFVCEVQVRTIVQHAWASISHSLDYKSDEEVPRAARRDLFRVAALLETGDMMFDHYRLAVQDLRASYATFDDWRRLPVDVESLKSQWKRLPMSRFITAERRIEPEITDDYLSPIAQGCKHLKIRELGGLAKFLEEVDLDMALETLKDNMYGDTENNESYALFMILYSDERTRDYDIVYES